MPLWKRLLLGLYYHGSSPVRHWHNARLAAEGKAPAIVLFYHRVADDALNPWTISNAAFIRQMRWLRERFEMISLSEAQCRLQSGHNERPTVTITFDDGYADNCDEALPFLIEHRIPCTYFVCSRNVLGHRPFPHDVLRGRPLAPNSPEQIREMSDAGIDIGAHTRSHADLGSVTDGETLYEELILPQRELEHITGRPVRYFAFPYGQHENLSLAAFEMARGVYDGVCSAYGGYNFPGQDFFHIERIAVDDELARLRSWVTLDPRKLRLARQNRYLLPLDAPAELEAAR